MPVAFKVVMKKYRFGTNAALYASTGWYNVVFSLERMIAFKVALLSEPALKPYFPRYSKNTVVKAAKGSVGLMAFSSKQEAEYFILGELRGASSLHIVRLSYSMHDILPAPPHIKDNCGGRIMNLLNPPERNGRTIPSGTIFLSSATVID